VVAWVGPHPGGRSTVIARTRGGPGHAGEGLGQATVEHIAGEGNSIIAVCPFARALARRPERTHG
jgi:predicted GNAT family acetyltransferase